MSRRSLDSIVTPPPSYHSADEPGADDGRRARATGVRDCHIRRQAHDLSPRDHRALGEDEVMVEDRSRNYRGSHHPPRRALNSHGKTGTAKLALEILKSNLVAAGKSGRNRDRSQERPFASWMQKLDSHSRCPEIHYAVHNHWYATSPNVPVPSTQMGLHDEAMELSRPHAYQTDDVLGSARLDTSYAAQKLDALALNPESATLFDDIFPKCRTLPYDEVDACRRPDLFPRDPSRRSTHGSSRPSHLYAAWPNPSDAEHQLEDARRAGWGADSFSMGFNSPEYHRASSVQCRCGAHNWQPHRASTSHPGGVHIGVANPRLSSPPLDYASPSPAAALNDYNSRWDYLDTVQQPYFDELCWPPMRPNVSFDHMKCDVFSFFARGCGLEPDRGKAPRLDFRLSPPSPYPSFYQRQQECERQLLRAFKQQVQREKLHWHEDKLGTKFPSLTGRDDERRKAVWAAIAEGSAVCDRRLSNMP